MKDKAIRVVKRFPRLKPGEDVISGSHRGFRSRADLGATWGSFRDRVTSESSDRVLNTEELGTLYVPVRNVCMTV